MLGFRRVLTSSSGTTSTARTAANAVANRVAPTGLEDETWVAADVENFDEAVFSEPLTIDELNDARSALEVAFTQSQEAPQLAPAGSDGEAISETSTTPTDLDRSDPDHQMQMLDRSPQAEFLDAAFIAAQNNAVKDAVLSVVLQSPEARASLERAFAAHGLTVNLTQYGDQGLPALPPAAAALQNHQVQITDITDAEEPHQGKLGKPLENFVDSIVNALGEFGGAVRSVLRKFIARWKHRFDRLFNPGAVKDEEDDNISGGSSILLDALSATAALIVILAVVRRVPGMR
eukprot:jgi/Ulvmu1/9195/UM005_0295.1